MRYCRKADSVTEPKNERAVCLGALRFLGDRRGEQIQVLEEPDRVERRQQAVEMVAASDSARFVVEHTRVESFEGQIADGKRLDDLLGRLETALPSFLPAGSYDIIIQPHAAGRIRVGQLDNVRLAVAKWILETAPGLKPGPDGDFAETDVVDERPWSITARPPGVPFDVTLQRQPRDGVPSFSRRGSCR
jgi:ribosomal protein S9